MPHSLFDDFKETGFHSSILSTFSVDPAFYDASLQLRLRGLGCQNNLLLADASMLEQSLEVIPDAFTNAGRKYLVVPVETTSCFHPKLALRYGKAKARLIIGSANVTSAGWAGNLELVSTLSWQARDEDADSDIHRTLFIRAHQWLSALVRPADDSKAAYKLELLRSQSPWVDEAVMEGNAAFTLLDGSQIDLLLSDPSDTIGLADRMLELVDEPVERLTIISPYWDEQLSALKRLATAVGNPDLRIFLAQNRRNPSRSSTFPIGAIGKLALKFHPIGPDESNARFLHAKMFLFQGAGHDFLFFGSANCTTAALGVPGKAGANHECLLFRKLPRGSVKKMLNLSYKSKIAVADIAAPPDKADAVPDTTTFTAGFVERRGPRLIWSPTGRVGGVGKSITVDDQHFPLSQQADGVWIAELGDVMPHSNIARVCLVDGRISRPVIIASPEELMRFAPFPVADSIRKKLDAVLNGTADLIGLAKDIHLLLDDDARSGPSLERVRVAGGRGAPPRIAGRDFATADEFRKALNLRASMKSAGLAHGENPALQALLQIVLRGMVNVATADSIDADDAAKAKGDDVGEDQDDVGEDQDDAGANHRSLSAADVEPALVSASEFERNQYALWRGIEKFQGFLERAKNANATLDLNFVTRSLFMLYLMLHGCTKRYKIEDGDEAVLIPFSGEPGEDFRDSFLFVAAQSIAAIWGPDFTRSLIGRLQFAAESDTLPIQITTLTIISRWVLAGILSEVRSAKAHKSLRDILEKQVPSLFVATKVFPELGQEELFGTIERMELNMGMDAEKGARIRETLIDLGRDDLVLSQK